MILSDVLSLAPGPTGGCQLMFLTQNLVFMSSCISFLSLSVIVFHHASQEGR